MTEHKGFFGTLAEVISPRFPDLKKTLFLAAITDDANTFLKKAIKTTFFISLGLLAVIYLFLFFSPFSESFTKNADTFTLVMEVLGPLIVLPMIIFSYLLLYPSAVIARRQKELDYEVVFAGRHIAIALKSGMPLFDSLVGASSGYGEVSKEFARIADKIVLGVPMSQAIRESTQYNPSKYYVRILMQISNSLASGADVGNSLEGVLDQISKEQMIGLREYSQKLTPLVMFYMVFGIIVPSLGVVLATVVFSAVSGGKFGFSSILLVLIFFFISVVQFVFLGAMESSRPKYLI